MRQLDWAILITLDTRSPMSLADINEKLPVFLPRLDARLTVLAADGLVVRTWVTGPAPRRRWCLSASGRQELATFIHRDRFMHAWRRKAAGFHVAAVMGTLAVYMTMASATITSWWGSTPLICAMAILGIVTVQVASDWWRTARRFWKTKQPKGTPSP